jgi:hypothetical protein
LIFVDLGSGHATCRIVENDIGHLNMVGLLILLCAGQQKVNAPDPKPSLRSFQPGVAGHQQSPARISTAATRHYSAKKIPKTSKRQQTIQKDSNLSKDRKLTID